jgi:type IV secretion system protein VirB9
MKFKSLLALLISLATTSSFAQPAARVVKYHANDIVAVRAKMRYTTLIQLPATEKIMQAATGDKDFWIIDTQANYCFLHPAKEAIHSDLNLITDKGNVYSFTLDDDESAMPDLKIVIEPSDASSVAAAQNVPRFVPATEVTAAQAQAEAAQVRARQQIDQFRSEYPTKTLQFDYVYQTKKPFQVSAIYRDDQFTYIRSTAREKFAVYEVQDGKPGLVNFQLKDGVYVVPKVIERGYLQLGKHLLSFEHREQ